MSDIDRLRAKAAHKAVMAVRADAPADAAAYRQRVRSLPAEIAVNGLGQALAVLTRDGKPGKGADEIDADARAARKMMDHLKAWICGGFPDSPLGPGKDGLMARIIHCDESAYVWAGVEAQAYLRWLKKLAEAYLATAPSASPGADRRGAG